MSGITPDHAWTPPPSAPSVTGWLGEGWRVFREEAGVLVMASLGYVVVALTPAVLGFLAGYRTWSRPFRHPSLRVFLLEFGVGIALLPLRYGFSLFSIAVLRGQRPSPVELLAGYSRPWQIVLASLLYGLACAVGCVLLVVPGIIAGMGLLFAPLLVVDRSLGPLEALPASWELTRGFRWRLLGLVLLIALVGAVAVLLTCGLGILVIQPLAAAAFGAAYLDLSRRKGTERGSRPSGLPPDPLAAR